MSTQSGVSGMPCPDCGERLAATMEQILSGQPIACRCGLTLRVDEEDSRDTLQDLRALQERIDQLRR